MIRLVLCSAAAGAMGWGIRGQYGHETGAMIAGLLVSLVILLGLRPAASTAWAMRAVALGTVAVGFGGAMTYGQTIGLTQDAALIGNTAALRWGLLGLALKGGLWIGCFGACLGMGLGRVAYRRREVLLLGLTLVAAAVFGTWLLNEPFRPEARVLPRLYFSASWHWRPDAVDLTPRREVWGGLLLGLTVLLAYTRLIRKDVLTLRLTGWGFAGGAIGFPLGQCLQAWHAWHPAAFSYGGWAAVDPFINWWNLMETTFGASMGAALAAGAWRHRTLIAEGTPDEVEPGLPLPLEWIGVLVHATLLVIAEFTDVPVLGRYADVTFLMGVLPLALAVNGRVAPALIALPVTLLPIAGKTVRRLAYEESVVSHATGWLAYAIVPLAITALVTARVMRGSRGGLPARRVLPLVLVCTTWTYFLLNLAFFRYPWPWAAWTNRTLHALVFLTCALLLTYLAGHAARSTSSGDPA